MRQKIETTDKEMNKRIDRAASRISGNPTVAKVMNLLAGEKPSQDYLKTYLKQWYS